MTKEKEFYIGWQKDMPKGNLSFLRKIFIPFFILVPILMGVLLAFQQPFNNYKFDLGTIKEFTGIYHAKPIPILEFTSDANLPSKGYSHALLIGFGKFGPEEDIEKLEKKHGGLDGKKLTVRGTLIHGDGKVLLELTEKEKSLIKVHEDKSVKSSEPRKLQNITLTGEITDSKCYFGAMKPGLGKIHKSCAIRCISGGVPAVFKTSEGMSYEYYVILGKNGEKINKELLPFVGEKLKISGKGESLQGWNVIYTDVEAIERE